MSDLEPNTHQSARIALIGLMGSGKTSVANYLVENYGFYSFAFAAEMKLLAESMLGRKINKSIDRHFLQYLGQIPKKSPQNMTEYEKSLLQNWLKIDAFFQYWCQEYGEMFFESFWAEKLFNNGNFVEVMKKDENIVIHDMRFTIENIYAKTEHFTIVKLNASKELCRKRLLQRDLGYNESDFEDISEKEFESIKADLIIDIDENTQISEIAEKIIQFHNQ